LGFVVVFFQAFWHIIGTIWWWLFRALLPLGVHYDDAPIDGDSHEEDEQVINVINWIRRVMKTMRMKRRRRRSEKENICVRPFLFVSSSSCASV
jgi:hypothetical protein